MIIIDVENYEYFDIGVKAKKLFQLMEKEYNVPKFFCINTKHVFKITFDRYLDKNFSGVEYFSVRSSGAIIDVEDVNFDGQFKSFNKVSRDDLYECIDKCFEGFPERENLEDETDETNALKMNVIIQEMITFDSTGEIFTSNPQGLLNERVIKFGDKTTGVTSYYHNTTDKIYYYETEENSKALGDSILKELLVLSNSLENDFGKYLNVEFVMNKDIIYILQARMIPNNNEDEIVVLSNNDMLESFNGLTLPLTSSFIKKIYGEILRNAVSRVLKDEELVVNYENVFDNIVGDINGRVYYRISSFYSLISALPFGARILTVWQSIMGIENNDVFKSEVSLRNFKGFMIYINAIIEFIYINQSMGKLERRIDKIRDYFNNAYKTDSTNDELMRIYDSMNYRILEHLGTSFFNDIYIYAGVSLLKSRLKKSHPDNFEEIANDYISSVAEIESREPDKAFAKLAVYLIKNKKVNKLKKVNENNIEDYLEIKGKPQKYIKNYIEVYGDKTLENLKLESDTFRSNPILLVNKIVENENEMEALDATLNEEEAKNLTHNGILVRYVSKKIRVAIRNREMARLNRCRYYGMIRTLFLTIGKNFVANGDIEEVKDIFYVSVDEIKEFIDGKDFDLKALVTERKTEYEFYSKLPDYSRLVFRNKEFNKVHNNINY